MLVSRSQHILFYFVYWHRHFCCCYCCLLLFVVPIETRLSVCSNDSEERGQLAITYIYLHWATTQSICVFVVFYGRHRIFYVYNILSFLVWNAIQFFFFIRFVSFRLRFSFFFVVVVVQCARWLVWTVVIFIVS